MSPFPPREARITVRRRLAAQTVNAPRHASVVARLQNAMHNRQHQTSMTKNPHAAGRYQRMKMAEAGTAKFFPPRQPAREGSHATPPAMRLLLRQGRLYQRQYRLPSPQCQLYDSGMSPVAHARLNIRPHAMLNK